MLTACCNLPQYTFEHLCMYTCRHMCTCVCLQECGNINNASNKNNNNKNKNNNKNSNNMNDIQTLKSKQNWLKHSMLLFLLLATPFKWKLRSTRSRRKRNAHIYNYRGKTLIRNTWTNYIAWLHGWRKSCICKCSYVRMCVCVCNHKSFKIIV